MRSVFAPSPAAAYVREVADDRLSHGDRTFAYGMVIIIGGGTISLTVASLLRIAGGGGSNVWRLSNRLIHRGYWQRPFCRRFRNKNISRDSIFCNGRICRIRRPSRRCLFHRAQVTASDLAFTVVITALVITGIGGCLGAACCVLHLLRLV